MASSEDDDRVDGRDLPPLREQGSDALLLLGLLALLSSHPPEDAGESGP